MSAKRKRTNETEYEVGFAKPPADHRFKTGISGNPKGRPKGVRDIGTALRRSLMETVVINEGGKRKSVSKLEVALKQLTNKAASGDLGALRLLISVIDAAEKEEAKQEVDTVSLGETDKKVMQGLLKRLATTAN